MLGKKDHLKTYTVANLILFISFNAIAFMRHPHRDNGREKKNIHKGNRFYFKLPGDYYKQGEKYFKDYEKYLVSVLLSRTTTNALVTALCEM